MAVIKSNVTVTLTGTGKFTIGDQTYDWGPSFIDYIRVSTTVASATATLNFKGNWNIENLVFQDAKSKIIDQDSGDRFMTYLKLGSVSGNIVQLKTTSIVILNGGTGDDDITLGSGRHSAILLGAGNDILKTGSKWVDTIDLGLGNDSMTVGSGGVRYINAHQGDDTIKFTSTGAEMVTTGDGADTITTSDYVGPTSNGAVGMMDTGKGKDTVFLGAAGGGTIAMGRDADTIVISKLANVAAVVTLAGGEGVTDAAKDKDSDTIDFSKFTNDLHIELEGAYTVQTGFGDFLIRNFENATGGSAKDVIIGNAEDNILKGNGGNDELRGWLGKDTLFGGAGKDRFDFDGALGSTNIDTVDDFIAKDDTIGLYNEIFTKAGKAGDLATAAFYVGAKAHDTSDRIIYDKASGKLWYDADGTGKSIAVQFALLDKGLTLTAADFDIIA